MLKNFYAVVSLLLIVLLQACSPIYKTNYVYHPIRSESEKARHCANDCINYKQTCRSQCLELQRRCEHDANILAVASDLIYHQSHSTLSTTRADLLKDCYKHVDECEQGCELDHKLCHENCGGEVTLQKICVQNCDNVKK